MNIQLGDEVRLRPDSRPNKHPFHFWPSEDMWVRVNRKMEPGWSASPTTPKNPLIMTIMDVTYVFQESDVLEHRTGPFWTRLLYFLMESRQK